MLVLGLAGVITALVVSTSSDPNATAPTAALRLGVCSVVVCVTGLQLALGGAFMSMQRIGRIGLPTAAEAQEGSGAA